MYVDDIKITGSNLKRIDEIKQLLSNEFNMTDLEALTDYLDMQVVCNRKEHTIMITQGTQIKRLLKAHRINEHTNTVKTPMKLSLHTQITSNEGPAVDTEVFQSAVGSLMYIMTSTRSDIVFTTSKLSQYLTNSGE